MARATMQTFLLQLTESGHVSVAPFGLTSLPSDADVDGAHAFLLQMDRRERLEFPGEAPALSLPAAHWAATIFHRACQFMVCRDVPAAEVVAALATPCPERRSPEVHYSVDLVLRYLPDLLASARRLAAGDALVDALDRLALNWPLSSVGVPIALGSSHAEIGSFIEHRGLRQVYVDRILQHDDLGRLDDPRVKTAVMTALGQHTETLGSKFSFLYSAPHDG